MKRCGQFCAVVALLLTSVALKADPIDPVFTMSDPDAGTPISDTSFSFSSNLNGGGFLSFVNESQVDWKGLAVQVTQPTGSIISCSGGPFFPTCLIASIPQTDQLSLFTLNLTLRTKEGGILNGEFFTINLNDFIGGAQPTDPSGNGGWGPDVSLSVQVTDYASSADANPEPATFFLFALGLALAFAMLRFRGKAVR